MVNSIKLYRLDYQGTEHAAVRIDNDNEIYNVGLTGTLANLALQFLKGECVLGIVLDRMEEEPLEFGYWTTSHEIVPQVVECFRSSYPNSISYLVED